MFTTVHSLITRATSSIAMLDAEVLLCFFLKKDRAFLRAHPEFVPSKFVQWRFLRALKKRATGTPVAYITGEKDFFGLSFFVNKYTLIPRPDTEVMVEAALDVLNGKKRIGKNIVVIDVGTGSGCIPIAVQKNKRKNTPEKKITYYATDISRGALRVARKNAKHHAVDIAFFAGDMLAPVVSRGLIEKNNRVIITANLPYLTEDQWQQEDSIKQEPKSALVAADQGLALYKELLKQVHELISSLICVTCFMEIDPSQTVRLREYVQHVFPDAKITIVKDYCVLDRIVRFDT